MSMNKLQDDEDIYQDGECDTFWLWVGLLTVVLLTLGIGLYYKEELAQLRIADVKGSLAGIELPWIYVSISFIGTILNMCGSKLGFIFWAFANSLWIFHFWSIGQLPQVVLFAGYLITSAIGFCIWAAKEDRKEV